MKRWMKWAVPALIAVLLLIPTHLSVDDGGTEEYAALLYKVTLRHTMTQEGEMLGYLSGTEVSVLGIEVYNDVKFVPAPGQ